MKNKILPFSVIIIFGIIFFIFYKGLEDSKIYTPDVNTKKEIPMFNTKEFFSGENVKSSSIFELDISNSKILDDFTFSPEKNSLVLNIGISFFVLTSGVYIFESSKPL